MGSRQRHCSGAACQKARKRDYQRRWRKAHPSEERGRRLREILSGPARVEPRPREPLAKVPWDEVETELGHEAGVVLMFVLGIVVRWLDTRAPPLDGD